MIMEFLDQNPDLKSLVLDFSKFGAGAKIFGPNITFKIHLALNNLSSEFYADLKNSAERNRDRISNEEIKKNASTLVMLAKSEYSLFSKLPDEILVKIAGHTRLPSVHSQEEAEKIAIKHLNKPKI